MRRIAAVVFVALALLTFGAGRAAADSDTDFLVVDVPGDARGFTHDPDEALLAVDHIAPGYSASSTLSVANHSTRAASLRLSFVDVLDRENGCSRQESRDALDDCADAHGELSNWLEVSVEREAPSTAPLWRGDFADVIHGVNLTDDLPARATWALRVTVSLPLGATNETMTDTVAFGTRLAASSETEHSVVESPQAGVPGSTGPVAVAPPQRPGAPAPQVLAAPATETQPVLLPGTGNPVGTRLLLLGGGFLLVGAAMISRSRRRVSTTGAVPLGGRRPVNPP